MTMALFFLILYGQWNTANNQAGLHTEGQIACY